MSRVAAAEFAADLRVVALPKTGQVGCNLNGPPIRCEQMQYHWNFAAGDGGSGLHPEKILQARFNPGMFAALIIDSYLASPGNRDVFWGHLCEGSKLFRR